MSMLKPYLEGLTAGIRCSVDDMLPRRATSDEREHVNAIIERFAADIIAAARVIEARNKRSRRPKTVSAARGPYLRLVVDNSGARS